MPARSEEDKPCLVETRQGLSVLYKNRYLYSKYNPAVGIERLVESLEIREATLVLCFSPVLGYGLQQLAAKMPQNAFMLFIAGKIKYLLGKYDDAKRYLVKSFEMEQTLETQNLLGLTYFELKDFEQANVIFKNLLEKSPMNVNILLNSSKFIIISI